MMLCALSRFPFPRAIEHSGAPPAPNRLANAVTIVTTGKPCERGRALPRDFADINTVNYIIEQIEHLRDEHGRGKRQRFAAHAPLGKVDLPGRLFLFQTGPSFPMTFCHFSPVQTYYKSICR